MKFPGLSSRKQVLGVMVDGTDLRIAQLGWEHGEVAVYALESVVLPARLGKLTAPTGQQAALIEEGLGDVFGLDDEKPEEETVDMDAERDESTDLSSTLINVFSKYPLRQNRIAVNIPEGQTTYYSFESDFGLKGKKLRKRLLEEISPLSGGTLDSAIIDHFPTEDECITVVVSEGQIPVVEEVLDIKNYLTGGFPYFCQVNSNELALINLVRVAMDPPSDKITAVVYIGNEFSRVIIMRGSEPISFIQAIREGYQSPQVCQTLFSKILLEQEEAGIPEIDQIVLAGEVGVTRAVDFFQRQFPDSEVKPITPGALDTSLLKNEELAIFSNFAIPVAMAWEALDKKNSQWLNVDLMPHSIKESQKVFKIAWHGFALLGVIFAAMLLITYQGVERSGSIRTLEASITSKKSSLAALQPDLNYIAQLQSNTNQVKTNLEFLDKVISDPYKWSRLFEKLSIDFKSVNRIWIDQIQSTQDGFNMIGKALTRDRIPLLAAGFNGVHLDRVTRIISEKGNIVYEFQLNAQLPPPPPAEEPEEPFISDDKVAGSGGAITSPSKAVSKPAKSKAAKPPASTPKPAVTKPKQEPVKTQTASSAGAAKRTTTPSKASANEYYNRGIELIRNHDTKQALSAFQALVTQHPKADQVPASHYWIGECHYSMGNYSESANAFSKSLTYSNNTKRAAGMLMLGMSYQKLGEKEKAKRQFEELIETYPDGNYAATAKRKLKALAG